MKNNYSKNIGSVSSGTMRPEDLIPTFLSELESQKPLSREHRKLVRGIKRQVNAPDSGDEPNYFDSEAASWDLEALFDALNAYCLPYFYFGAHPGNGADYGYWLSEGFEEQFADASASASFATPGSQFPESIKVNDLSDVPTGFTGEVLHVNDHNYTLYYAKHGRLTEIWAIV